MRTLAFLLMLSLALAGCSGDESSDPTEEPTESTSSGTQSQTQSQTPTTGNNPSEPGQSQEPGQGNQAPTGTLTASISQGEAPVEVTFTLEGADPDGDNVTWTLDADGDGTFEAEGSELPAMYNHSYVDVGNYTANLTISDGSLSTSYEANINATQAAAADPGFETIIIKGTISGLYAADPLLGAGVGYVTDPNSHEFDVPAQPTSMQVLLEWDDFGYDMDFDVFAPDGTEAASAANYNDPVLGDNAQSESAEIADATLLSQIGTWTIDVLSAGSYESEYTVTITFTA